MLTIFFSLLLAFAPQVIDRGRDRVFRQKPAPEKHICVFVEEPSGRVVKRCN